MIQISTAFVSFIRGNCSTRALARSSSQGWSDGMVLGVRSLPQAKQLEERFAITDALEVVIGG